MKPTSKRLKKENKKINKNKIYEIKEAIALIKTTASAKFNESIEAHISLNINAKFIDQQVRTTVTLPNGTGKNIIIGAIVSKEKILEAKAAGADIFGSQDLIDEISKNIIKFDLLICTSEMMPKLAKLGRILGPKGLMPSPKLGTVTSNIKTTIEEFKKGKFEYKADKTGIVHISFGKKNFSDKQLLENLREFYNSIIINKPIIIKGNYIKKLSICSTMGPSIFINLPIL